MATPTVKAASENGVPAPAEESREEYVSALQQVQQLSVDATQSWVKAASVLPVMSLTRFPVLSDAEAVIKFSFDVATDLLNDQREFALLVANIFVPSKTALIHHRLGYRRR